MHDALSSDVVYQCLRWHCIFCHIKAEFLVAVCDIYLLMSCGFCCQLCTHLAQIKAEASVCWLGLCKNTKKLHCCLLRIDSQKLSQKEWTDDHSQEKFIQDHMRPFGKLCSVDYTLLRCWNASQIRFWKRIILMFYRVLWINTVIICT